MSGENVFDELDWRGLVHQATDPALGKVLDEEQLTAYIGFDPTGDSFHVGSLLQIVTLRRLQEAGLQTIALLGGGTGLIGDPSFRADERQLLSPAELEANLGGLRRQLEALLPGEVRIVNNGDWLNHITLPDFLRDVGKHFSVNEMIRKESVRARLEAREQGISFTEFSYMLLQAWDFVQLYDEFGCRLQLGGSDQWGNITEGIDLIRRLRRVQAYGVTSPLITLPSGAKMGKSESSTRTWLDAKRTSAYQFYQYWIRAEDALVGQYLRFFTFLPRQRIEELDAATRDHPERREAQQTLAWEVTAFVHGEQEATKARDASGVLFSEQIAELDEATLLEVFAEAPSSDRPRGDLDPPGLPLIDALTAAGLVPSKSAARTTVTQGGAYVNNRRETGLDRALTAADTLHDRYVVLRKGKRDHHLLRFG